MCFVEQCGVTGKHDVGHMNTWLRTQLFEMGTLTSRYLAPESSQDIYFNDNAGISRYVDVMW